MENSNIPQINGKIFHVLDKDGKKYYFRNLQEVYLKKNPETGKMSFFAVWNEIDVTIDEKTDPF